MTLFQKIMSNFLCEIIKVKPATYSTAGSTVHPTMFNISSIVRPIQATIKEFNTIKVEVMLVVAN
jgi:hypothetical protein